MDNEKILIRHPLHYEHIDWSRNLWGDWLIETAKDIAAVRVLEYIEEAGQSHSCRKWNIPDCEVYHTRLAVIAWWSPCLSD